MSIGSGGSYMSKFWSLDAKHVDGVPWDEASMPALFHLCRAQTDAWQALTQIQRCACGAMRTNRTSHPRWHGVNERRGTFARAISWLPLTCLNMLRGGAANVWLLFAVMMVLFYAGVVALSEVSTAGTLIGLSAFILGAVILWPIKKVLEAES